MATAAWTKNISALDEIVRDVNRRKIEPAFSDEVRRRLDRYQSAPTTDTDMLREMASLIAYSQNARSGLVGAMLESGAFERAFQGFNVDAVAILNPKQIKAKHWNDVRVIRFPGKLSAIVNCAKALLRIAEEHRSFRGLLSNCAIPNNLETEADVSTFWTGFDTLRRTLNDCQMPFFRNDVSLLHLLLHLGYDCLKPDLIVMRVAKQLGLVDNEKSRRERREFVHLTQSYSVSRGMKPAVLDLYLLVFGGQEWATQFAELPTCR